MRVMLDTNILISGMVFIGPERRLLELLREGHTLLVNDYLLAEAREVLARKFPGKELVLDQILESLAIKMLPLPPAGKVREAAQRLRDPKDAVVVASALAACPDIFVSGDKDLHTPEVLALVQVSTTREALALLKKK
ncbi:MAG: putative toxin-antitoxin system toxin component, PIN family [Clostridia bacterium]|nr:MAG: putative toxin-antitoxin system toxin component, PIN family [Clostridia bacterium]